MEKDKTNVSILRVVAVAVVSDGRKLAHSCGGSPESQLVNNVADAPSESC